MYKLLSVLLSLFPVSSFAASNEFDNHQVLFGNLHAHSSLSDDVPDRDELKPLKAYTYARDNGLDFLVLSDHHKATDSSHRLSLTASEFKTKLRKVALDFNSANPGEFIAISGLEWGNTATGNHVNIINPRELPPNSIKDKDYDDLLHPYTNTAYRSLSS